jgi:hypothetical protein
MLNDILGKPHANVLVSVAGFKTYTDSEGFYNLS